MCCKLLSIGAIQKPRLQWCTHCDVGKGCSIYDQRPQECRTFYCGYLLDSAIEDFWMPAKSKMVLTFESATNQLLIHVDPSRKGAWRQEPYHSRIRQWAAVSLKKRGHVIVWQGDDWIAILPDREVNLGPVDPSQVLITTETPGPSGVAYDIRVVEKGDPALDNLNG